MTRATPGKIPSKTVDPILINYCLLTLDDFVRLVNQVNEVVNKTYKEKATVAIEVPGYDEPFASTTDFKAEVTQTDWKALQGIEVSYFRKEDYSPTVRMRFGKTSWDNKEGARIDILQGSTTDKLTIKGLLARLAPDYTRRVYITDRMLASTGGALAGLAALIYFARAMMRSEKKEDFLAFYLALVLALFIGFSVHFSLTFLHKKFVIPHLELVGDDKKTKFKTVGKLIGALAVILGLLLGIMAL